jgi:hypothetical protein
MAHPTFTILLARQRTGTNALRSVLETHPDIGCFDEVFKIEDRTSPDPLIRASNYFTFLERYCAGDITRSFPDRHAELFDDYLAYLRDLLPKRHLVVDVKYNSTHHITGVWRGMGEPTLFDLIKARNLAVLQLTRRNLLRCLVSSLKGHQSKRYYVRDGMPPPDLRIEVPPDWALNTMEHWAREDEFVARVFGDLPHFRQVEYAELFPDASGAIAPAALQGLAGWFDVAGAFVNRASLTKQSWLPLDQTIANYDDVRAALRGTRFEFCLEDEPAYQAEVRR